MNIKTILLVLLATSFLLFGCAGKGKQQDMAEEPPEVSAPPDGQPAEEPEQPAEGPGDDASDLADLFQVDTDKPISDEGFDVSTPSSD